jgi:predicted membrane metal-binding protein
MEKTLYRIGYWIGLMFIWLCFVLIAGFAARIIREVFMYGYNALG